MNRLEEERKVKAAEQNRKGMFEKISAAEFDF